MTRILQHFNLLSNPTLDKILPRLNGLPIHNRRKLLNTKSEDNPYPHFLYKFRPLNNGNTEQISQLRDYLVDSRLWLSSPAAFNDPFDMRANFIFEGRPHDKRKHLIRRLKAIRPELTKKEREAAVSDLLTNHSVADILAKSDEMQRSKFGVCSFTEEARNILMWTHYGSNHTGVSLQFQITQDIAVFSRALLVEYDNEYPVINYLGEDFGIEIGRTLLRKSEIWYYEKERRIFHPDVANQYLAFKPTALTALILGCAIETNTEENIKELLIERRNRGHPPIRLFRAIKHKTQYRLCLQRISGWIGCY